MVFKDQMELRRSLMDLNNTSMEIGMESGRHALTVSEWEGEQTKIKEVCMVDLQNTYYLALPGGPI